MLACEAVIIEPIDFMLLRFGLNTHIFVFFFAIACDANILVASVNRELDYTYVKYADDD